MSEEEIEKLAFANRKQLANLNGIDLLTIIEFLQIDRKQWINQYSNMHNEFITIQQKNRMLEQSVKDTYDTSQEMLAELQQENNQLKLMLKIGKTCAFCPYFKAKEQLQQKD